MYAWMKRMKGAAERCADRIKEERKVHLVSHIDADGLASAAITVKALERAGIGVEVEFVKQLDVSVLERLERKDPGVVIFTDLGSSMAEEIMSYRFTSVILDHHLPSPGDGNERELLDSGLHLNPHLFGINGSYELSGSGVAYIFAQAMAEGDENNDLADIAVVGAVGDLQDKKHGKLVGVNRQILEEGAELGIISYEKDLRIFGRQTRPIYKMLQYSTDPYLPGLSGDEKGCIEFFFNLGVNLKDESKMRWRRWIDLPREEKQRVVSGLIEHCIHHGVEGVDRLVGEVYTLEREEPGSELRDATEFSTLLNSTARYEEAQIGLRIAMGDRGEAYRRAKELLREHRRNLSAGVNFVKENGIKVLNNIQYFYAGDQIKETIVGIIAGMSAGTISKEGLPIVAFAKCEEGLKVSARATHALVKRGLNLARAITTSASRVGGSGGGHDIAAGAVIPEGSMEAFLALLDEEIGKQIR
ncbi:MAG: DHH family phosphoesterase [Candidatus Syntrophoarchaeum sp. WYZ-LMO15]|nr:MAG: DHH family phosphoesterase [Candidatus Syntrophoarchaeum sp. WYZ-LMO15]